MSGVSPHWLGMVIATLFVWALLTRVRAHWRGYAELALVMAWSAALFSWSVSLEPARGAVSGRVVSTKSNQPLAQARVFYPEGASWVRTDANGCFQMHDVPVGRGMRITARAKGYETAYDEVEVVESRDTAGVVFRMTPRPPSFTLYNGERVFTANEKPKVSISGNGLTEFNVALFRLDPHTDRADVLEPRKRKALGERLAREENSLWETHYTASLDADGDFDGQITVPSQLEGLYFVRVESEDGHVVRSAWFLVTDLAIVTRRSPHEIVVFAQRFSTGKPVSGALLSFFAGGVGTQAKGRAKPLRTAVTDTNGLLTWREPGLGAFELMGQSADSYAYSRIDAIDSPGGAEPCRVYLYTDRPIYRPSHEVHIRGVARRDRDHAYSVPRGASVQLRVCDARGATVAERSVTVGDFGGFDADVTLPARAALGDWNVTASIGASSGSARFKVAEYRKPEYRVEVKPERARYAMGEAVRLKIDARYFFGAPVAGAKARYTAYESWYRFDRSAELEIDDGNERAEHYGGMVAEGEVRLDAEGAASITFTPERAGHDRSYWVEVEVEDPSHRTVSASADVMVTQGDLHLDASTDRWGYALGQKVAVNVAARAFEGDRPVSGTPVRATLARIDAVEKTVNGRTSLERQRQEVTTSEGVTNAKGDLSLTIAPPTEGTYELHLEARDGKGRAITRTLFVFVWSTSASTQTYGGRDLTVLLDAPRCRPGGTANVVVTSRTPNAYVLVCVDGRRIYQHRLIRLRGTSAVFDLPVPRDGSWGTSVEISAFEVKGKQLQSDTRTLVLDTAAHDLKIAITPARAVYAPGETVKARVHVTDATGQPVRAELSLGVVDAAIYALAPDTAEKMHDFFYGIEPSCVRTEYSFAPDYSGGRNKEDDPRVRRNFRDTAWWAPALRTDADGNVEVTFALPDNITAWRFTARAVTLDHQVGEATAEITSRKPLLVRLEAPRFMVERDAMELSAVVHNETDSAEPVRAAMTVEGLRLTSEEQSATLAPHEAHRFAWRVEAKQAGTAQVTVTARGDHSSDAMALSFPILPHGVMRVGTAAGQASPTLSLPLTVPRDADVSRSRLTVHLAPSLIATAMQGLDYLASYPYGCVEQTMSAFIPDLVVKRALEQQGVRDSALERRLPNMIARGLDRIYDMQHENGAWGWWKDDADNPYCTAYVVSGLHRAREAGFAVRDDVYKRGLDALRRLVAEDVDEFREGSGEVRQRTLWNVKAYEARVLDEVGVDAHALALQIERHTDALTVHAQALLVQTLWHVGEKERARALLEKIRERVDETETQAHWESKTLGYGWLDDPVETTSAVLRALLMVEPTSPQVDRVVRWLVAYRKGGAWSSTRSTAAVIDVFTEIARSRPAERAPRGSAEVRVNGALVADVPIDGPLLGERGVISVPSSMLRAGENVIETRRVGGGTVYVSAMLESLITAEASAGEDHGLIVERAYARLETRKDEKGRLYTEAIALAPGASVPVGARIRVTVSVKNKQPVSYLIIEDKLIPGCEMTEAEATRSTGLAGWVGREAHDDALSMFASRLEPGVHRMVYEIRAEASGVYHVRPAEAYLMYTPEVRGTSAEASFTVSGEGSKP